MTAGLQRNASGGLITQGGARQVQVSSATIIDGFESQSLAAYSGDTGGYSFVQSPVYNGSYALRADGNGSFDQIISTPGDGLPNYFPKGTQAEVYFYATGYEDFWAYWFGVENSNNHYTIQMEYSSDDIDFNTVNGGSASIISSATDGSLSLTTGQWYLIRITRYDGSTFGGSDNDIRVHVIDTTDSSTVWDVTANNSDHESFDGVGYNAAGASNPAYWDHNVLTGGV